MEGYLEEVKSVVCRVTCADPETVLIETPLSSISGMTNENYAQIINLLEEKYELEIELSDLENIQTVGDLCLIIISKAS